MTGSRRLAGLTGTAAGTCRCMCRCCSRRRLSLCHPGCLSPGSWRMGPMPWRYRHGTPCSSSSSVRETFSYSQLMCAAAPASNIFMHVGRDARFGAGMQADGMQLLLLAAATKPSSRTAAAASTPFCLLLLTSSCRWCQPGPSMPQTPRYALTSAARVHLPPSSCGTRGCLPETQT